ncbi:MAG TPA: helix-turn-helix domain-containing protein [Gammaproteobacteria bacterium]|nr:helix-turn-helix domain-containing protein [Gammaproteobacteria bacterium]
MNDVDLVFKALADPVRRRLLDRLYQANGQTLGELCKGIDMARQSVTQHLELLEEANLISVEWQGREKLHYVNPVPLHDIYERWIRKYEQQRLSALYHFKTKLERK